MMKNRKTQHGERPYKAKTQKSKSKVATNFAEDYGNTKKWFEELPEEPNDFGKVSEGTLIELKDEAKKCNDTEVAAYNIKNAKTNSDYQWIKTVMSKGTISDKIAAYTVLIQDDPVCNLNTLRNLINMVKVGKKKECLVVMDTLSELFISDLLRPNSKLKPFHDRPLSKLDELTSGSVVAKRKYLSIWFYEDQLKECYTIFVQALNTAAHDSVDANKEKAINAMYKLLVGNPEQEKNLLANIVNKLGDPSQKVASKAIYCLGQVLHEHPNMKQVILNEIERLLFRPNISPKAQYYGVCFLNQFCLGVEDYDVAKNLIRVYFAFFKGCIRKGDVDSRLMSALLMGVNRAYPYAKTELTKISEHIDTMYKVVHIATFNVSLHALNLLYQISDANDTVNDRFYSALYKKILDPQVGNSTQQALFLNLVYRSLKRDSSACRIRAFIKRLLQVTLYMQPPMACGILFLVNQLIYKQSHLLALKSKMDAVDIEEDDGEHYSDVQTDENKIYDNNKKTNDVDVSISEKSLESNERGEVLEEVKPDTDIQNASKPATGSWFHSTKSIKKEFAHPPATCYTSLQRNPLYAGAEFCVYFELLELQNHYHPTVALYANQLLKGQNITYSGDPLKDFTLIRFLERFSFKNPKKSDHIRKPGVNPVFGQRKLQVPSGVKAHAVNSTTYLNIKQNRIPVEELFMYTYLQRKQRERVDKDDDDDDDESDVDSVGSDEFEEMLNNMSGGKKLVDEDLDYMHDVGETLKNTKKGKQDSEDELDEMDHEDDDEFSDQGNDFGDEDMDDNDDNEQGFNTLDNNEDNDGDDESEDFDDAESDFGSEEETQTKKSKKPAKKRGKDDFNSIFASADEFASLLDEDNDFMAGTSRAISNKDNSNLKQLNWEQKRNKWVRGVDGAMGKRPKHKQFSKKRANNQVSGPNNKKQKRF